MTLDLFGAHGKALATIPGLSLAQPYASLAALGIKPLETRKTRIHYRGPLVICATKTPNVEAWSDLKARAETDRHVDDALSEILLHHTLKALLLPGIEDLPTGVALAIVDVVGCRPLVEEDWQRSFFFAPGRWAWELSNPRPLKHVKIRGMNGLFPIKPELVERARLP